MPFYYRTIPPRPMYSLLGLGFMLLSFTGCADGAGQALAVPEGLPDPLEAGWAGERVCEVVEDNAHHRILKCRFAPGVGHEQHYHAPHTGYTLAGGTFQITSASGTRTVAVPTGSSFTNEEVTVHEVLNVGQTTAEFLIIEPKE